MANEMAEALLEMHYHKVVIDSFRSIFGANFVKLYKPTQQREAWVGFDQAWTRSDLTQDELFDELRSAVSGGTISDKFYFGYFMQYKVVQKVTRRSKYCPSNYSTPYYRSEISLKPNKTTKISQHNTLKSLSSIPNAFVYYVCPMILSSDEIYNEPDPNLLKIVQISSSPGGWSAADRHFLTFRNPSDPSPIWNSEPVRTRSFSLNQLLDSSDIRPIAMNSIEIISLVSLIKEISENPRLIESESRNRLYEREVDISHSERNNSIPTCFNIVEMERNN